MLKIATLTSPGMRQVTAFGALLALGSCGPSDEGKSEDVEVTSVADALYLGWPKYPTNANGVTEVPVCIKQNPPHPSAHIAENAIRVRSMARLFARGRATSETAKTSLPLIADVDG